MLIRNVMLFPSVYVIERVFTWMAVRGNLGSLALLT